MMSLLKNLNVRAYARDEKGSIIVFVMVVFSAMFLVGGAAVDLARHETLRATLQYNLDRAVLAAASLKQSQEPEIVVQDYMSKVNTIESFTVSVVADVQLNSRDVQATATTNLNTWFLSMAGIDTMPITATSRAAEKVPKLEISIVLDVSGSMSGSKLTNLKVAAKEFITTMLLGADPDTVSISIVPFNQTTTPGESIYNALKVNETHTYSTCLEFADADFSNVAIDPEVSQIQAVYTSVYSNSDSFQSLDDWYRTCYTNDYSEILAYQQNETTLHDKIDSLVANGMTSGHMGLKWGLALLDPEFDTVVDAMILEGTVDDGFSELPVAYTEAETLKVVILMGDGGNTYEWKFGDAYRGDNSNLYQVNYTEEAFDYAYRKNKVWRTSNDESKCSNRRWVCVYTSESFTDHYLYRASNNKYWDIENSRWIYASTFDNFPSTVEGYTSTVQTTWEYAWGQMSAEWYDDRMGNNNAHNDLYTNNSRSYSQSDTVMSASCTAGRDAGIVVYTIGFETNTGTTNKLRNCASTASHYYDAEGTEISTVFAAIAASIQKLKLTQ